MAYYAGHIDWHLEAGLAVQLVASPLKMQELALTSPPPSELASQCAALGLPSSGNAAGHDSITDLQGLPEGPFQQNLGWHSKGIGAMAG